MMMVQCILSEAALNQRFKQHLNLTIVGRLSTNPNNQIYSRCQLSSKTSSKIPEDVMSFQSAVYNMTSNVQEMYELFLMQHVMMSSNQCSPLIWDHPQVKPGRQLPSNWTGVRFHDWKLELSFHLPSQKFPRGSTEFHKTCGISRRNFKFQQTSSIFGISRSCRHNGQCNQTLEAIAQSSHALIGEARQSNQSPN